MSVLPAVKVGGVDLEKAMEVIRQIRRAAFAHADDP
jgi:hypothetical protein